MAKRHPPRQPGPPAPVGSPAAPLAPPDASRLHRLLSVLCGLVVLAAWLPTLPPTVTGEDSGEFIAAAWTLGIVHPPGYPLWTLIAHPFTRLPLGDVAWRLNFMSALWGAAAIGVLAAFLLRLGVRPPLAASGALLVGCGANVWSKCIVTEVNSLNLLCFLVGCHLFYTWFHTKNPAVLSRLALLAGLSVGVHHTALLVLPVLFLAVLWHDPAALQPRRLLPLLGWFALGLSVYLYLPLRAATSPAEDWGHPATWPAFWDHVTRRQYGSVFAEPRTGAWTGTCLAHFGAVTGQQLCLPPLAAAAILLGIATAWRQQRRLAVLALLAAAILGPGFMLLIGFAPERGWLDASDKFMLPFDALLGVALAVGLEEAVRRLERSTRGSLLARPAVAGLAVLPFLFGLSVWPTVTMAGDDWARVHAENLLATVGKDAVLFCQSDYQSFPLWYLQKVEGRRPDVTVVDPDGDLEAQLARRGYDAARVDAAANAARLERFLAETARPVYFTKKTGIPLHGRSLEPEGVLYHLLADGRQAERTLRDRLWRRYASGQPGPWLVRDDMTAAIASDYAQFRALEFFARGAPRAAMRELGWVERLSADNKEVLNNVGSILAEQGRLEEARDRYQRAVALNPHYLMAQANLAKVRDLLADREQGRTLEAEVARHPQDPVAHHNLATWQARQGRLPEAEREYRRALALDPRYAMAWRNLGALYAHQPGQERQQREAWEQYLKLAPEAPPDDPVRQAVRRLQQAGRDRT